MDSIFSSKQGRIFFFVLALIIVALSISVARPYINTIILSVIVAYVVQPLYKALQGRVKKRKERASIISTVIVIIFTLLIITVLVFTLLRIISLVITELNNMGLGDNPDTDILENIVDWLNNFFISLKIPVTFTSAQILEDLQSTISQILSFILSTVTSIGTLSVDVLINLIIFYGLLILFTPNFDDLLVLLKKISPFPGDITDLFVSRTLDTAKSMAWGLLLIALVQGGLAGLVFAILGVKNTLLYSVLVALFSFLPILGTGMITLPIAAFFLFDGELVKGIVLIAFQVIIIGNIDPILRSRLIPKDVRMPMVVSLIAILGGLAWLGIWGLIYGPVFFSLLLATFELVKKHFFIKKRALIWKNSLEKGRKIPARRHRAEGWHVHSVHPARSVSLVKPKRIRPLGVGTRYRRILKRYLLRNKRARQKIAHLNWSSEVRRR